MIGHLTYPMARVTGEDAILRMISQAGFNCVDYSMHNYMLEDPIYCLSRTAIIARFGALRKTMEALGLSTCQLHAHYPTLVGQAHEDERIFRAVLTGIWAAEALKCPYVVIHPMHLEQPMSPALRQKTWELNCQFFKKLSPVLRECRVQLGIENMFAYRAGKYQPTPISTGKDMAYYIDCMNDVVQEELFVACLDTGHAHLLGLKLPEMVEQLGKRLKLLHIHDNSGECDAHTAPYLGGIQWDDFVKALAKSSYDGVLSFETHGFVSCFPPKYMPAALDMIAQIGRRFENMLQVSKGFSK